MKKYIRFGHLPKDEISKVHKGDSILHKEKGVSVWDSVIVNNVYFPMLPENPNEDCLADYFYMLFGNKPVYLVTGEELDEKGSVGEPLLRNVTILKEITESYKYLKRIMTREN